MTFKLQDYFCHVGIALIKQHINLETINIDEIKEHLIDCKECNEKIKPLSKDILKLVSPLDLLKMVKI